MLVTLVVIVLGSKFKTFIASAGVALPDNLELLVLATPNKPPSAPVTPPIKAPVKDI